MSDTKHTPGPWKRQHLTITAAKNGAKIAEIDPPHKFFKGREREEEMAYCRANACLIAAAPDLLEALQALMSDGAVHEACSIEDLMRANSAIAKATGGGRP